MPLERRMHTVAEPLDDVREYCRDLSTNQRFDLAVTATDCRLEVDKAEIDRIFTNPVSNAVKFSSEAGVIRSTGALGGGRYRFEVADQGMGIRDEEKCRAFDRFFRTDASDTALGGIGMGMSLVKAIVGAHGGDIRLESQLGVGTRIAFTLPLADASA